MEEFFNQNFNVGSPSLKRNSKKKEKKETSKKRSNSSSSSSKISFDSFVLLVVVPPEFIKNYCTGSKKRLTIKFTKKLDNFDLLQEIYEGKVIIILLIFDEYFFRRFYV